MLFEKKILFKKLVFLENFILHTKQNTNMIKAIIFDFGGVLSKKGSFKPLCKKYSKKHKVSYKGFHDVLVNIWLKTRVNKVDSKLFWKECADYLNTDPKHGPSRSDDAGFLMALSIAFEESVQIYGV